MYLDNGFKQQELSGHATLDDCIAEFNNKNRYHQAPVVEAFCSYVNNTQPTYYLMEDAQRENRFPGRWLSPH